MFINDLFVRGPRRQSGLLASNKIGNRVSVGTNATILPVTICDDVVIGAGAVVTKDITEPGIYVGNPARLLRRLKTPATIPEDRAVVFHILGTALPWKIKAFPSSI